MYLSRHVCAARGILLAQAKLMQPLFVDAQVVTDLVKERPTHLLHHRRFRAKGLLEVFVLCCIKSQNRARKEPQQER